MAELMGQLSHEGTHCEMTGQKYPPAAAQLVEDALVHNLLRDATAAPLRGSEVSCLMQPNSKPRKSGTACEPSIQLSMHENVLFGPVG